MPFGDRVVAVEPPAREERRVILPPGVDAEKTLRGIVVRVPLGVEPSETQMIGWFSPTGVVLRPGDVIYFSRFVRIGEEMVVDGDDIFAYEPHGEREDG